MINVLIADDHKLVRDGLHVALKNISDLTIIAEVIDGPALVSAVEARHEELDLILLDLTMPHFPDPVAFVRYVKAQFPRLRMIVMTGQTDDTMIIRMIEAGVDGYLLKTSTDDLKAVIERVVQGERYFSHAAAQAALTSRRPDPVPTKLLSQRESDVLFLVVQGLTNDQIAERLQLAEGTIRNYVTRLMEKSDVTNRTALAAYAIRHGLVPPPK